MSAPEELFHLIAGVSNDGSRPWCDEARRLLDAYAHELAEKIRGERYIHDCCPECHAAADACANLIDPEKESTR